VGVELMLELSILDGTLKVLLEDLTGAEADVGTEVSVRVESHG